MITSSNNKDLNSSFKKYANMLEKGLAMEVIDQFYSEVIIQFEHNTDIIFGKRGLAMTD